MSKYNIKFRKLKRTPLQQLVIVKRSTPTVKKDFTNNKEGHRNAGGTEAIPGSNPWIVGLFLKGTFHCGEMILDEQWVKYVK